ncbi:MAG TPA: ImmA/IrrE family metallo-endopeptidase [Candidatus Nanopelagicales bacterium]|nr:ImmA/IrrE family metallo-endopeptidase [Candidatus Nanopelagicales bacterium]
MDSLADLGKALAQLRSLLGLSLEACSSRVGITVERLTAAERGDIQVTDIGSIARLYALDEDKLREGMVMPLEGVEGATVFLLHGPYQDFDARDLGVLDRAMRAARAMTALSSSSDRRACLERRLQFVQVPPAGPRSVDAARQGHKLARLVRAKLSLGGEPIGDMRSLLEDMFGIAVLVDDLVSTHLRAASIIDAHRAAAAAVLAGDDPDREKNPVLARVYLAHELCHLLFDPGSPDSVRLALDDRPSDRATRSAAGSGNVALLESRAKGFAAELLIPLEGLRALLSAPMEPVASLSVARRMVTRVRDHFGTPREIAAYHLGNLGFIQQELTLDLLPGKSPIRHETSLPSPGSRPRLLEALVAERAATDGAIVEWLSAAGDVAAHPPSYVEQARRAAAEGMDQLTARAVNEALNAVLRGRETDAVDLLVEHFDDLLLAGEIDAARRALGTIDPQRLPPKVLTGVLMVTAHAPDALHDARVEFFGRVKSALAETWQLGPEAIASIARRLS